MQTGQVHRKPIPGNHAYAAWEASGLRWLAAAGGAACVDVLDVGSTYLDLPRLDSVAPTVAAARDFGAALAATHDAGATAYGVGPDGWAGDGWLGPSDHLLPLPLTAERRWGTFYAEQRILSTLAMGMEAGTYGAADAKIFRAVAERVLGGEFDDEDDRPARLHGDLWSGNVMWTADGVVLIDPAAHGGHRETDLAMLALFGAPHLGQIIAAYDQTHPLRRGWQHRVRLHQLHPVMLHAVLFGGGFVAQSIAYAEHYR